MWAKQYRIYKTTNPFYELFSVVKQNIKKNWLYLVVFFVEQGQGYVWYELTRKLFEMFPTVCTLSKPIVDAELDNGLEKS